MATVSIVDYLKGKGQDASMGSRSKLASQHGIKGYKGTAQQNLSLLSALQKPKVAAPVKGKAPVKTPVKAKVDPKAAAAAKAKADAAAKAKAAAAAKTKQAKIDKAGAAPGTSSAAVGMNPAVLDSYGTTLQNLNMNKDQFRDVLLGTKNTSMTIDEFAAQQGFDYSKEYANKQAEAIRKSKEDGYNNNLREVDKNVMNAADALDKNYYLQGLQQNQAQAENGLNAGIASDQDLRMAMSRQSSLGEVYRDANQENMRINDSKGRLGSEAIAYADELYNTRRNEGYQNTLAANQNNMAANQAASGNLMGFYGAMEGTRQFNNNFALQEGALTGNYMAYDQRAGMQTFLNNQMNLENNKLSSADRSKALAQNNAYLNQLAATGVDVTPFMNGAGYTGALSRVNNFNQTMDQKGQNADIAFQEAEVTGTYEDPEAKMANQEMLSIQKRLDDPNLTTSQRYALTKQQNYYSQKLSGTGNNISTSGNYYDYLKNAKGISHQTQGSKEFDKTLAEDQRQANMSNLTQNKQINNDFLLGKQSNANNLLGIKNDYSLGKLNADNDRLGINNDYQLGKDEIAFRKEELTVKSQLEADGYDLEQQRIDLDDIKLQQEQDKINGKATSAKSTTEVVGKVLSQGSRDKAIAYIAKNSGMIGESGADIVKVLAALDSKWPGASEQLTGNPFGGK